MVGHKFEKDFLIAVLQSMVSHKILNEVDFLLQRLLYGHVFSLLLELMKLYISHCLITSNRDSQSKLKTMSTQCRKRFNFASKNTS